MKTIDFCIPFIGSGLPYTEFLISNLLSTAAHPERISISLSVHSQRDAELIKNSSFRHAVKHIVMARDYKAEDFFISFVTGSANHCSAIQSLFVQTTADVVIFSDYDMAFLVKGWDTKIIEILETNDLCGVGYPNVTYTVTLKNYVEMQLSGRKYQNTPNLSFLAITRQCIESYFLEGISNFNQYLFDGGLHLQFVNTPQMAEALHVPLGTFWCMDSGFEIPFVIQSNALNYQTFMPVAFDQQTVFSSDEFTEPVSAMLLPDLFIDSVAGEPILAHYTAGTKKSLDKADNNVSFDYFKAAIGRYLDSKKNADGCLH